MKFYLFITIHDRKNIEMHVYYTRSKFKNMHSCLKTKIFRITNKINIQHVKKSRISQNMDSKFSTTSSKALQKKINFSLLLVEEKIPSNIYTSIL